MSILSFAHSSGGLARTLWKKIVATILDGGSLQVHDVTDECYEYCDHFGCVETKMEDK